MVGEPQFRESDFEKGKFLDVNIVALNYCKTIDEMIDRIGSAQNEGGVDSVLLGEYDFTVEDVLADDICPRRRLLHLF